jgi:hypothetical protein
MTDHHLFLSSVNPAAGREREFNELMDNHHVREAVENIDGFVAAQRYVVNPHQRADAKPVRWRYVTAYELVGDDVDAIHRSNTVVRESGVYTPYDGLFDDDHAGYVYSPVGELVTASESKRAACDAAAPHIMLVRSNPGQGREAEFGPWYENHLHEVLDSIDGYVSAQRYWLNASQRPGNPPAPWRHIAVYEIRADDVEAVHASNLRARAAGAFTPHEGILTDDHVAHVYTPLGPRIGEPR